MFTGIVQGMADTVGVVDHDGIRTLTLRFSSGFCTALQPGASVAVSGVCLTVTACNGDEASFDCIAETLRKTTLRAARTGERRNVERAARLGDEIGGHCLSGHVSGVGKVASVADDEGNRVVTMEVEAKVLQYVFDKGFVGIDGCSLTVVDVNRTRGRFDVHLIPETRRVTTLGTVARGDQVNIEIDALTQAAVDTVLRLRDANY